LASLLGVGYYHAHVVLVSLSMMSKACWYSSQWRRSRTSLGENFP
jgi:hypothetical protein